MSATTPDPAEAVNVRQKNINYFLSYDNNQPLFIGGMHHGQKMRVPEKEQYWRVYCRPEPRECLFSRIENLRMQEIPIFNYRAIRIRANDREFRVFVHELLDADAAFMLLMSTCAASPKLLARIKELEEENRNLRGIIALMSAAT